MARPNKSPPERLTEIVRFRLPPGEFVRVQKAAIDAGKSLSEYARSLVIEGRVVVRTHRQLDPHAFDQLRRIGVNLNQAVRLFHANKSDPPPELLSAAATVERFLLEHIGDGS